MTLRITRVSAAGFKSKRNLEVALEPVTLIVGPNGSGKSIVLESISYALSGHISGIKATELGLLLPDPKTVSVLVEAADTERGKTVTVSRGIGGKKRYARGRAFSQTTGDSHESNEVSAIDSFVVDHFGKRAGLFLEAFDPDKNIWSLSAEARLSWTFGIVAHASGWTKERLGEVFKDLGYGNIDQGRDVVECLDINVRGAAEWARNTAKSVREYEAILGGLTDAISEPKAEEVEAAKRAIRELRDRFVKSEAKILRDGLVGTIAAAETDLLRRMEATRDHEGLLRENARLVRERTDLQKDAEDADVRRRALQRHHAEIAAALQSVEETGACPTCGATYTLPHALNTLASRWFSEQRARESEIERLGAVVSAWDAGAETRKLENEESARRERILLGRGAGQVADVEKALVNLKSTLVAMGDTDGLEDPATVRGLLEEAEAKLEELQSRIQLATERAKKTADRAKAEEAARLWKARHEELQDVRGHILVDARRAVEGALDHDIDDMVAPHNGRWRLDLSDETGIDIAYEVKGGSFVKYKGMSSGERIVATVVLLTALRRLLGPTPWSALLVDNLELTSYAERVRLVTYVAALSGLFSNVILLSSDTRPVGSVTPIVCE